MAPHAMAPAAMAPAAMAPAPWNPPATNTRTVPEDLLLNLLTKRSASSDARTNAIEPAAKKMKRQTSDGTPQSMDHFLNQRLAAARYATAAQPGASSLGGVDAYPLADSSRLQLESALLARQQNALRGTENLDVIALGAARGLGLQGMAPAHLAPMMGGSFASTAPPMSMLSLDTIQRTREALLQQRARLFAAGMAPTSNVLESLELSLVSPPAASLQLFPNTGMASLCAPTMAPSSTNATGRRSLPRSMSTPEEDDRKLADAQIFLRKHIEIFEATQDEVGTHTRGRNKPIQVGQVGIRCIHCAHMRVNKRQRGATYYPATLLGLYQAAQNMNTAHMQTGICDQMPQSVKDEFAKIASAKNNNTGAGRPYWANSAKKLGLYDTEDGVRFMP
ncbi:expressed unknown protein [Seminavis robusta]|uniref:Uncharacterized protein n=1 Tax=Seminavis robusta TaxID=568900 RepID=A0A9N8E6D1_9STRA|nr:expressed unknown protein [Seminavis robusta]|eukprot:Sro699_g189370.1 n/a (392) ;mRNA; f:4943-6219